MARDATGRYVDDDDYYGVGGQGVMSLKPLDSKKVSKTDELREALIMATCAYVDHVSDKVGGHFSGEGARLCEAVKAYRARERY